MFFRTNLMHGVRIRELNVVRNCLNRKYDSVISDKTRKLWILLKKVVIFNISLTEIRNHPKNVILEKITIVLKNLQWGQCPIYNGTLKTLECSSSAEIYVCTLSEARFQLQIQVSAVLSYGQSELNTANSPL